MLLKRYPLGNGGRNIVLAPGYADLDRAIVKQVRCGAEPGRWEINLFNRVNSSSIASRHADLRPDLQRRPGASNAS